MTCNAFFHFFHTLQGHCILADSTARMRQRQCEYVSSNMLRNTRAWHILVPRCCKDVASDKLKTVVHPMDKKGWLGSWKRVPEIGNQSCQRCRWWICEPRVTALFLVVWSTQYFEKQFPCWKIGLWTVCGLACHLKRNFVREPRLGQSIQQHIVVLSWQWHWGVEHHCADHQRGHGNVECPLDFSAWVQNKTGHHLLFWLQVKNADRSRWTPVDHL